VTECGPNYPQGLFSADDMIFNSYHDVDLSNEGRIITKSVRILVEDSMGASNRLHELYFVATPLPAWSWNVSPWTSCSSGCGDDGMSTRVARCEHVSALFDSSVKAFAAPASNETALCGEKPPLTRPCNRFVCEPYWEISRGATAPRRVMEV
jgi:hypothetical protein